MARVSGAEDAPDLWTPAEVVSIDRGPGDFQQPVEPSVLLAICRRALGPEATVRRVVELGIGTYNSTYRVELADGEPVILRIAPEPTRQGAADREAMRNEYAALPFLAPLGSLVPRTLAVDFTHQLLDRDYLVQTLLPGLPASPLLPAYSAGALRHLYRELGSVTRTIHDVTGTAFGPVAGPLHAMWSAALGARFEQLADAFTAAGLDAGQVRRLIAACARHREALDEITVPALLHGDLWTLNLLVDSDPDRPTITGVLDCDAASWGDPMADWPITRVLSKPGTAVDAFWQTYGRPSENEASRVRALLTVPATSSGPAWTSTGAAWRCTTSRRSTGTSPTFSPRSGNAGRPCGRSATVNRKLHGPATSNRTVRVATSAATSRAWRCWPGCSEAPVHRARMAGSSMLIEAPWPSALSTTAANVCPMRSCSSQASVRSRTARSTACAR
jgi:aminoglycoside phosphotransferase (APT) family kinase protein